MPVASAANGLLFVFQIADVVMAQMATSTVVFIDRGWTGDWVEVFGEDNRGGDSRVRWSLNCQKANQDR